jgi:hypothetical protein
VACDTSDEENVKMFAGEVTAVTVLIIKALCYGNIGGERYSSAFLKIGNGWDES